MTTTASNDARPRPTYLADQHRVPATDRARDLLALARFIADNTDPAQRIELTGEDRLELAMALPNVPDDWAQDRLLEIVGELHCAEQADNDFDHNNPAPVSVETYRESAAARARDAIDTDLRAAKATRGRQLRRMGRPGLARHYRTVSGYAWSTRPPEQWPLDELVQAVLTVEFRPAALQTQTAGATP